MANFDFESLKEKAAETANSIADKSADVAKKVADKATVIGKKAKLNVEIVAERETLKKKYQELGRLYYEKYSENLDPDFAQTEADIKLSLDKISAKQTELDELRVSDDNVEEEYSEDGEFDDVKDEEESSDGDVEIELTIEEDAKEAEDKKEE